MTDADRPLLPEQGPAARALGPAVRLGHFSVARGGRTQRRGRCSSSQPTRARRAASGRAAVLLRAGHATSRISPTGRHCPTTCSRRIPDIVSQRLRMLSALPRLAKGIVDRRSRDAAAAPAAADVHRCPRVRPVRRRSARRRAVPRAAERRWLRRELAGHGARRVRGARLAHRPVPDGQPDALSHRPVRRRGRDASASSIPRRSARATRAQALRLLPAREFPLTAEGIQAFKRRFRNRFPGDLTRMSVYRDIAEGAPPPGIEYYLPLFFDATATLFDYLPANTIVAVETRRAAVPPRRRSPKSQAATSSAATTPSGRS